MFIGLPLARRQLLMEGTRSHRQTLWYLVRDKAAAFLQEFQIRSEWGAALS